MSDLTYRIPAGVRQVNLRGRIQLTLPSAGRIWIDKLVLDLWRAADQSSITDLLSDIKFANWGEHQLRCGLACLAEAGLLDRSVLQSDPDLPTSPQDELVSVVIVTYNSRAWLKDCLLSIAGQTYNRIEIIIVDNASQDDSVEWVRVNAPLVKLVPIEQSCSLAEALNTGIELASGEYILVLNPDVLLDQEAIKQMVLVAQQDPACAAVAAKLHLLWAPSFLNGLGNLVGAFSWGTDIGLGHLDLGQFALWEKIPSACFAAALIPIEKFKTVGNLDQGFPMYYEDSEWCYRARLLGFSILAAPQARCLHAFGSKIPSGDIRTLSNNKLRRVTYGRLRFITRLNGNLEFLRFFLGYLLEDILRGLIYLFTGKFRMSLALLKGWSDFLVGLPEIVSSRRDIQSRRKISDRDLFSLQKKAPIPLIQTGLPVLTWDVICNEYAPLIKSGNIHQLPEFPSGISLSENSLSISTPFWKRAYLIWKNESLSQLLFWAVRRIQWWFVRS
jgi:GT2 family glycosyltransferase